MRLDSLALVSPFVLCFFLCGCESRPASFEDVHIGMTSEEFLSAHEDVEELKDLQRSTSFVGKSRLAVGPGTVGYRRELEAPAVFGDYYFVDGRLETAVFLFESDIPIRVLRDRITLEHGAPSESLETPTLAMYRWEPPDSEISLAPVSEGVSIRLPGGTREVSGGSILILSRREDWARILWLLFAGVAFLDLVSMGNLLQADARYRKFLREVSMLEGHGDMKKFKEVAARSMYGALVQLALMPVSAVLFGAYVWFGIVQGRSGILPVLVLAGFSLTVYLLARSIKPREDRIRKIPAAGDLEAERDRIVRVWAKKPLPDW